MKVLQKILNGMSAGLMIVIGCAVYLVFTNEKVGLKSIGALFFAVALLTICYKGYSLYTGKIGYIVESRKKEDVSVLLLGLLGNALATFIFGIMVKEAIPNLHTTAETMCQAKLDNQNLWQTFTRGLFCGVLMYVAVSIYKENKTPLGIIFAIPVFILSGFEHSIADMGYFAISGIVSLKAFVFIMVVVLGNTIGAWILPLLSFKK